MLQLERKDEAQRSYSNFRRFNFDHCLRSKAADLGLTDAARLALVDGQPRTLADYRAATAAPDADAATSAARAACPFPDHDTVIDYGGRHFHHWLETTARPRFPQTPWLHVTFEALFSADPAEAAAATAAVDAFVAGLVAPLGQAPAPASPE